MNSYKIGYLGIFFSKIKTPSKLRDLTYCYLKKRAKHNLAFAQIHQDKQHYHVHIAISPNGYKDQKVTHINKERYQAIRLELERYQQEKYPELSKSIVFLQQKREKEKHPSNKEFELLKRGGKSTKEQLKTYVKETFAKSYSQDEFLSRLVENPEIQLYKYRGTINGIRHNGKKYRFKTLGIGPQVIQKKQKHERSLVQELINIQKHRKSKRERGRGLER